MEIGIIKIQLVEWSWEGLLGLGLFIGALYLLKIVLTNGVKATVEQSVKSEFDQRLERFKTDLVQEIEILKAALARSQPYFIKQMQALEELNRIFRGILPVRGNPHMEWSDACEDIAISFGKHRDALRKFLADFSTVIPSSISDKLDTACDLANEGTFKVRRNEERDFVWLDDVLDDAEKFYEIIQETVKELQAARDAQVDTRVPPKAP